MQNSSPCKSRLGTHKQNIKSNNMSQWPSKWRQEAPHHSTLHQPSWPGSPPCGEGMRPETIWIAHFKIIECLDSLLLRMSAIRCRSFIRTQEKLWVEVLQWIPGPLTCKGDAENSLVVACTCVEYIIFLYTILYYTIYQYMCLSTLFMYLLTNPTLQCVSRIRNSNQNCWIKCYIL